MNMNMNMNMASFVPTLNTANMRLPTAADVRDSVRSSLVMRNMPTMGTMGTNLPFGRPKEAGPNFDVQDRPNDGAAGHLDTSSEQNQDPSHSSTGQAELSDSSKGVSSEDDISRENKQNEVADSAEKIRERNRRRLSRRNQPPAKGNVLGFGNLQQGQADGEILPF